MHRPVRKRKRRRKIRSKMRIERKIEFILILAHKFNTLFILTGKDFPLNEKDYFLKTPYEFFSYKFKKIIDGK